VWLRATNNVGGAEHDIVALGCGLLRGLDRGREFRQAAAERAKPAPLFGAGVVVRQQRNPARIGGGGEPPDRSGDVIGPAFRALHYGQEIFARDAGALDHLREVSRAARCIHRRHVIIEGDGVDPALGEPGDDLVLGVEIVGLVTKMVAGVGAKPRPQPLDAVKDRPRILRSAQASLPRPGHAMEDGGDAVGERLSIAFKQCHVEGKSDSRPRHHLPLERVAVHVDDPGEDQKARGIDRPLGARLCADARDHPALAIDINAGFLETSLEERATSFDAHHHDR